MSVRLIHMLALISAPFSLYVSAVGFRLCLYSCLEKGCGIKSVKVHATIPKGINSYGAPFKIDTVWTNHHEFDIFYFDLLQFVDGFETVSALRYTLL